MFLMSLKALQEASGEATEENLPTLEQILKKRPDLAVDSRTIDPRLDPEIEQWIRVLADLIPKMRPLAQGFNACDQAALLPKEAFASIKDFDLFHGAPRFRPTLPQRVMAPTINMERNRIGFKTARAWDQYLAQQPPTDVAYGFAAQDVNHVIKACFESWFNKLDQTPEQPLQADFIARLKASNGLGYMLAKWHGLYDKPPEQKGLNQYPDLLSKIEILGLIADMFYASYFEPLGITAPIKLSFQKTKNTKTRNPGYYDKRTEKIVIKVGHDFGQRGLIGQFGLEGDLGFYSVWKDFTCNDIIMALVEELHHNFVHQVVKKYLQGDFPKDSPWANYAKPLVPQFLGTPGCRFYTKGTYYLLNPLERAINPIIEKVSSAIVEADLASAHAKHDRRFYLENGYRMPPLKRTMHATDLVSPESQPVRRRPQRGRRNAPMREAGYY